MYRIELTEEEYRRLQLMLNERLKKYQGEESAIIASIHDKLKQQDSDNSNFYDAVDY
tara:strand:+ start:793 stop:963 length:171 start_codon:yes stop_codon:yes gene_type:complete